MSDELADALVDLDRAGARVYGVVQGRLDAALGTEEHADLWAKWIYFAPESYLRAGCYDQARVSLEHQIAGMKKMRGEK